MKCTITWTRPAPTPAAKQQAPTATRTAPAPAAPADDRGRASRVVTRERRLLAQLRRTAAERRLDEIEQGTYEVLTQAERSRNSILYSRDGKYMWVPWDQIEPYRNRLAE